MGDLGGAGGWGYMRGGMGAVPKAIAGCATAHGCEIRTDAEVAQILVENGRATGVALQSGEEISANIVVTGADPKTSFLKLVDTKQLPDDFVDEIRNFRTLSSAFKINMAVDTPPVYTAFNAQELGIDYPNYVHIGPTMEYLEKAYDDAKYGRPSKRPFFTPCVPTVVDDRRRSGPRASRQAHREHLRRARAVRARGYDLGRGAREGRRQRPRRIRALRAGCQERRHRPPDPDAARLGAHLRASAGAHLPR
jgi:phytoene dehydrogenase-like protein